MPTPSSVPTSQAIINLPTHLIPNHQLTRTQKAGGILGLAMGATVVYAEFTLGQAFGQIIGDKVGANHHATQFIKYFFALGAMIPTAALVGVPTQDKIIALLNKHELHIIARRNLHQKLKTVGKLCGHLTVSLTGTPFAYILIETAHDNLPLQIFWAALTFVTSYLSAVDSVFSNIEHVFSRYEEHHAEILIAQNNLQKRFADILHYFYQMPNEEVARLFTQLTAAQSQDFLHELKNLPIVNDAQDTFVPGIGKKIIDAFAIVTGTAATYGLYAITEMAAQWAASYIGIENEQAKDGLANTIALVSTIPNTLFLIDFTKRQCNDFYYMFNDKSYRVNPQTSKPRMRKMLRVSSLLLGSLAAVGNTYLAIQNAQTPAYNVFVPFSFLGSSLAQSKAMDMLLQRAVDAYDWKFCQSNSSTQRDILIKVIIMFKDEILPKLSLTDLSSLNQFFTATVETPTDEPNNLPAIELVNQHGLFNVSMMKQAERNSTPNSTDSPVVSISP